MLMHFRCPSLSPLKTGHFSFWSPCAPYTLKRPLGISSKQFKKRCHLYSFLSEEVMKQPGTSWFFIRSKVGITFIHDDWMEQKELNYQLAPTMYSNIQNAKGKVQNHASVCTQYSNSISFLHQNSSPCHRHNNTTKYK